jgi:hypothetical protein
MSDRSAPSPGPVEECFGLCRVCGRTVLPSSDPSSCTATLCSEECLAQALIAYWAARGVNATVVLRNGYARLEELGSKKGTGALFRGATEEPESPPLLSGLPSHES